MTARSGTLLDPYLLLALLILFAGNVGGGEWPQLQGPNHDGSA